MHIDVRNYRISPYKGNTCWKIQEKSRDEDKSEWKESKYYPSTLTGAFIKVRELARLEGDNVKSIDEAIKELKALDKEILDEFSKLRVKFPDAFN